MKILSLLFVPVLGLCCCCNNEKEPATPEPVKRRASLKKSVVLTGAEMEAIRRELQRKEKTEREPDIDDDPPKDSPKDNDFVEGKNLANYEQAHW